MCSIIDGLIMPDCDELQKDINDAVIRASKEVQSGSKIIKMIFKQHHITGVSYAGDAFYKKDGRVCLNKPKVSFKYKIEYDNCINGKECIWCFN